MITAQKLREKNIAEYLLYMWHTEDLMRAFGCDEDRVAHEYLARFNVTAAQAEELRTWYADLCRMMREEGVTENGHLQVNKNVMLALEELSHDLLRSANFPRYHTAYYRVLPDITEVRNHGERKDLSDIETCFDVLYGIMLLRLQKKTVSPATTVAAGNISALIGLLAAYYKKHCNEPLDF